MQRALIATLFVASFMTMPASADEDQWEFTVGGLLHTDTVVVSDDLTPIGNDTDFRRARVNTQARYGAWRLRADYEFGLAEGWRSAFVEYRGVARQRWVLGNQVAPFSLEDLTGSRQLALNERSIASALSPGMLTGISWRTWRDRWSFHAGLFGDELSDLDRRRLPGTSAVGRLTFAPALIDNHTLHFGIAAEYRDVESGESVRLRARPGTRLTDVRLVDTGNIDGVDSAMTIGAEMAWVYDRIKFQSELTQVRLDGQENQSLSSRYLALSYLIGAKPYRYRASRGNFRAIEPAEKWGALEVTARFATLDLSDGAVTGGQHDELSIGLSYIFNEHLRVALTHAELSASPNRDGIDESVSVTSLRLQVSL